MTKLKSTVRNLVPASLWYKLASVRRAVTREQLVQWYLSPRGRQSRQRLRAFREKHRGERCFILGNGPSLKHTDLSLLRDEWTFGLNRIYLLFPQMGFVTTYHVTVNELVIDQCAAELSQIPCPKFFNWRARDRITFTPSTVFLCTRGEPGFFADITRGVWTGATVTYVAMQIAYYMGFHQVILVGVDHSFATQGKPHAVVTSKGDDPNHFDPTYFGKGFRWQLPDLETSEVAYRLARDQYKRAGREIVDATIGGKLQVFPKVDYLEVLR